MEIQKIVDKLANKGFFPPSEKDLYIYGINTIVYTVWSTGLLLLIGALMHRFIESCIIVFGFYTLQSYGGYHANSHLACFLVMLVGLLSGLAICQLEFWGHYSLLILMISAVVLIALPLTLHPNKSYLEFKQKKLIRQSRVTTVLLAAFFILLNAGFNYPLGPGAVTFLLSSVSRVVGKWKNEKSLRTCI